VQFKPEGNGRDLYIAHGENRPIIMGNNGHKIPYQADFKSCGKIRPQDGDLPNFRKPAVVPRYALNGQGRDTFIGDNNGGFQKGANYNPHNFFKRLRLKEGEFTKIPKWNKEELAIRIKRQKPEPDMVPKINFSKVITRLNQPRDRSVTRESRRDKRLNKTFDCPSEQENHKRRPSRLETESSAPDNRKKNLANKTFDAGSGNYRPFYGTVGGENGFSLTNEEKYRSRSREGTRGGYRLINKAEESRPERLSRDKLKRLTMGDYFQRHSSSTPIKRSVISRMFHDDLFA
jgi:hypothetical protein